MPRRISRSSMNAMVRATSPAGCKDRTMPSGVSTRASVSMRCAGAVCGALRA
jgi:hypothetical protein